MRIANDYTHHLLSVPYPFNPHLFLHIYQTRFLSLHHTIYSLANALHVHSRHLCMAMHGHAWPCTIMLLSMLLGTHASFPTTSSLTSPVHPHAYVSFSTPPYSLTHPSYPSYPFFVFTTFLSLTFTYHSCTPLPYHPTPIATFLLSSSHAFPLSPLFFTLIPYPSFLLPYAPPFLLEYHQTHFSLTTRITKATHIF